MLKLIRNNGTLSFVLLLFMLIALRLPSFFETQNFEYLFNTAEPLSRLLYSIIIKSSLDPVIVLGIATILLVLFQALLVNQILIKYKTFDKEGFLPAFIYVFFMSIMPEFKNLSPILISITFLIPVVDKMLEAYDKEECFKIIYDSGFLIGLASLFYFPSAFFLVFAFWGLATIRSVKLKEWITVLIGFVSVYILSFTVYYMFDETMFNFNSFKSQLTSFGIFSDFNSASMNGLIWVILLSVFSFYFSSSRITGTLIQFRKFMSLLAIYSIVSIASFFLPSNDHSGHLLFYMLPLSVSFNNVFVKYSETYIGDLIFAALFCIILLLQYLPYFYML